MEEITLSGGPESHRVIRWTDSEWLIVPAPGADPVIPGSLHFAEGRGITFPDSYFAIYRRSVRSPAIFVHQP